MRNGLLMIICSTLLLTSGCATTNYDAASDTPKQINEKGLGASPILKNISNLEERVEFANLKRLVRRCVF